MSVNKLILVFSKNNWGVIFVFTQVCFLAICLKLPSPLQSLWFFLYQFILASLSLFCAPTAVSLLLLRVDRQAIFKKWATAYVFLQFPLLFSIAWLLLAFCVGGKFYGYVFIFPVMFIVFVFGPFFQFLLGFGCWLTRAKKIFVIVGPISQNRRVVFFLLICIAAFFGIFLNLVVALYPVLALVAKGYGS